MNAVKFATLEREADVEYPELSQKKQLIINETVWLSEVMLRNLKGL